MKEYKIKPNDAGQRLDKYLFKAFPAMPGSLIYKYIRLGRVKVNGKKRAASDKLAAGDTLQLYINDELLERPDADSAYLRLRPQLDVVYEDAHILLADKPAGMLVHEDEHESVNTLINHIKAYLRQRGEWDPADAASFAPALCNRIDRNTGGIVIAAKTAESLRVMNEKIRAREISKYYLCLVHGVPAKRHAVLENRLSRDTEQRRVFISGGGELSARLEYTVLDSRRGISLLECRLITGRTHQIRAQMAAAGHPLVGDTKYGTAALNVGLPFKFQALYSYRLAFDFKTPAGELEYLRGRSFEAPNVPFLNFFESLD